MTIHDTICINGNCNEVMEYGIRSTHTSAFSPNYVTIILVGAIGFYLWMEFLLSLKKDKLFRKTILCILSTFTILVATRWWLLKGDDYGIAVLVLIFTVLATVSALSLNPSYPSYINSPSQKSKLGLLGYLYLRLSSLINVPQKSPFFTHLRERRINSLTRKSDQLWQKHQYADVDQQVFWKKYEDLLKKMKKL